MTLTTSESHYITTNIGEIIDTMDATIDPNIVDVINMQVVISVRLNGTEVKNQVVDIPITIII